MTAIPTSLEEAIAQARESTQAALAAGLTRIQVELKYPELKVMPIAEQFLEVFADYGANIKVYFPDAGAAALARRDWGPMAFEIRGMGEIKGQMQPDDRAFLMVEPSAVEVLEVEKLCEQAGDRPVVLLLPDLESVATVGIGYAARQLRERFLNSFDACYYLRPTEGAVVIRRYPSPWQVWLEKEEGYELLAELPQKPSGDDLDQLLLKATATETGAAAPPLQVGLMKSLQRFMKALGQ